MKFARYLEENAVVEWRKAYINYRGLKKLIKRVDERHKARLSQDLARWSSKSSSSRSKIVSTFEGLRRRPSMRGGGGEEEGSVLDSHRLASAHHGPSYGGVDDENQRPDSFPPVSLVGTGLALASLDDDYVRASTLSDATKVSSGEEGTAMPKGTKHDDVEAGALAMPGAAPTIRGKKSDSSVTARFRRDGSQKEEKRKKRKKPKKAARNLETYESVVEEAFDKEERKFFGALDNELERIVAFYETRESDMTKRYEMLARQLQELADHRREYKASHPPHQEPWTDLGHRFSHLVPTPISQPAQALKRTSLNLARPSTSHSPSPKEGEENSRSVDEGDLRRAAALSRMLNVGGGSMSDAEDEEVRRLNKAAAQSHDVERYKAARKKLKAAVLEYYRGLEILKNYKILNRTGFAKILKKLEKATEVQCGDAYYSAKVAPSILVCSESVEKLLKGTEEIYTAYFEHGNRKRALERLRINAGGGSGEHGSTHHLSVARTGFYLGVSLCATVGGLIEAMQPETQAAIPLWQSLLRVYAAELIPTVFCLLFGLNLAIWHRARVNTVFIFEWDVRHALDYHKFFELPAFFLLLLSLAFWLSFLNPFPNAIAPTTWPLVWLVTIAVIILDPLPINVYHSRRWLVFSLVRVLQGGLLFGVEFRDFFLGDELNSINWSISMLWFMGCEYNTKWAYPDRCDPNQTWWTAVLLSLPAFLRLLQCLRRFSDSNYTARLHLINGGKYASAILYYFFYINYRYHGSGRTKDLAIWCVFGCLYSLYTSSWDIIMDWSLLRRHARYPWLRNELVFESYWPFYYWAMFSNVLLRFGWIIYLLPGPASSLLRIVIIAILEMLRRFQWNFLRLENEHLGNVDMYRVSREIPLPYHFTQDRSKLDKEEEEEEEEDEVKGPAFGSKAFFQLRSPVQWGRRGEQMEAVEKSGRAGHPEGNIAHGNGAEGLGSGGDKGKQRSSTDEAGGEGGRALRLSRKVVDHLVPDRGGFAATGAQLDDVGAAHGARARDYQPRERDVDGAARLSINDMSDDEVESLDAENGPHTTQATETHHVY